MGVERRGAGRWRREPFGRQEEEQPAGVPGKAKQAGDTRGRWTWVEPNVWTERMLTEGVKGGKWFSLLDQYFLC